jgi:peptidoglycan/xylan/chitin deacetylase (PgdA/CDA1 family)
MIINEPNKNSEEDMLHHVKTYIATSWDDGLVTDLKLIEILQKYNANCSFGINSRLHSNIKTSNDYRDKKYGVKLTKSELSHYGPYDIWNHTATHQQVDKLSNNEIEYELETGKKDLENLFGKEVDGIIWPYGVYTINAVEIAKRTGHKYSRTTPGNKARIDKSCIVPVYWYTNINSLLTFEYISLSGHTYEIDEVGWAYVDKLYEILTSDKRFVLVTLTEMAQLCLSNSIRMCLRQRDV